jgi:hypothetical protein
VARGIGVPEEIALGVEPGDVEPGRIAQLLQLRVVDGYIWIAIVPNGPIQGHPVS